MLDKKDRQKLISLAQTLEPLLILGKNGLSENIYSEIEAILDAREILKIRLLRSCDVTVSELIEAVEKNVGADCVNHLGSVAVFYKRSTKQGVKHLL